MCATYGRGIIDDILTTADAATFQTTNFSADAACGGIADPEFCAPSRTVAGDIELGIAFEYEHVWMTGILPFDPPTFTESQSSSTFAVDGIDITNSTPLVAPGNELFSNPGTMGPYQGHTPVTQTVTVTSSTKKVCVSFDLNILGGWDAGGYTGGGNKDDFSVTIGGVEVLYRDDLDAGSPPPDAVSNGSGFTVTHTVCEAAHSGTSVDVSFLSKVTDVADEEYSITNINIFQTSA